MVLINIFRIIAFLEGLSYILLLFVAVPIKYFAENPFFVKILGMPHGILFLLYLSITFALRTEIQWFKENFISILVASIIPFGTFAIEKKIRKQT